MNQLSWLLYWGNVAGNMGAFLSVLGFGCLFGLVVRIVLYSAMFVEVKDDYKYYRALPPDTKKLVAAFRFPSISVVCISVVMIFCWTAAAFCPSSTTVYAIAASQIGEKALQTPLAGKAGDALNAWLDKQIASDTPTSNKSN